MTRVALLLTLLALTPLTPSPAAAQNAEQVLASFEDEPSILEVQRAALNFAGLDPELISSWYARANTANLLPQRAQYRIQIQDAEQDYNRFTEKNSSDVGTDTDTDFNALGLVLGSATGTDSGSSLDETTQRQNRTDTRIQHQVLVQWDLSEVIFNPDILRVSREVGRQVKQREDLLNAVTKLYFERRRAQVDLVLSPPTDAADRLRKQLAIQELTAQVDALTGGWFGQKLSAAGKDPY
jgi:hypothetical protein